MTERYSQDDVVATVTRLTHTQLVRFIDGALVKPQREEGVYVFWPVDISRLELLCDLSIDMEMDDVALGIVISLLDQLHAARKDLADLASAIDVLPTDLQENILTALKQR